MDLSQIPIFQSMGRKMAWQTERQQVLAQNIANANTPDYQAHDLRPLDFRGLVQEAQLRPALTNAGHMSGSAETNRNFRGGEDDSPYEVVPTENAVTLEDQVARATENAIDYQKLTNLYSKHVSMITTALGRSGG